VKEYLLTTNEYLEPKVVEGSDAYGINLTRLLLLEPGTNPLHPGMGVGIGPRYRFMSEGDIPALQSRIQDQVNTYLPSDFLTTTKVYLQLKEDSKYLLIVVEADDTKYVYDTENSGTPMELSDLIS